MCYKDSWISYTKANLKIETNKKALNFVPLHLEEQNVLHPLFFCCWSDIDLFTQMINVFMYSRFYFLWAHYMSAVILDRSEDLTCQNALECPVKEVLLNVLYSIAQVVYWNDCKSRARMWSTKKCKKIGFKRLHLIALVLWGFEEHLALHLGSGVFARAHLLLQPLSFNWSAIDPVRCTGSPRWSPQIVFLCQANHVSRGTTLLEKRGMGQESMCLLLMLCACASVQTVSFCCCLQFPVLLVPLMHDRQLICCL